MGRAWAQQNWLSEGDIPALTQYAREHPDAFGHFLSYWFSGTGRFGYVESKQISNSTLTAAAVLTPYGQVSCFYQHKPDIDLEQDAPVRIYSTVPGVFPTEDNILLAHDCGLEAVSVTPPTPSASSASSASVPRLEAPSGGALQLPTGPRFGDPMESAPAPSETEQSSAFEQGREDRRAWESWLNAQSGEFRAGAYLWSGQRSLRNPIPCNSGAPGDWRSGCEAARAMLAPFAVRRRSETEYRAGWNSY